MATTTISGTTDVEDTTLYEGEGFTGDENWGGYATIDVIKNTDEGTSGTGRGLIRCSAAAIPAGTINSFTLTVAAINGVGGTIAAYRVKDANTWVEGTKSDFTSETGSSCWNKRIYNTTNWAGSVGCGTSGTDYFADASPPSINATPNGSKVFTLTPSWASDWRDSVVASNGLLLKSSESGNTGGYLYSTENTTPVWTIDYTAAGSGGARMTTRRMMSQGE